MVDIVLKLTNPEVTVTTANTVYNCVLARIYAPADTVITVKDKDGNTRGSMSMPGGFVEILEKIKTDTIEATVAIKCTPVAYK